jgi:hypothetical protein
MKLRRTIIIVIIILVLFSFTYSGQRVLFPIQWWSLSTFAGRDGLYNTTLREYRCSNPRACKHEQGHQEDHLPDWFSETEDFEHYIATIATCNAPELSQLPYIQLFLRSDWESERELYADIYGAVDLEEYNSLRDLLIDYAERCENE